MWLVTGFAPFGGQAVNPSWEAVRALPDRLGGVALERACLPVAWDASVPALCRLIDETRPEGVLCVGQAGGRAFLTPERVAINLCESAQPDNAGVVRFGAPVVEGGPDAYFSTLPVHRMAERLRAEGLPARVSYSAGAYLCNFAMYAALHKARLSPFPFLAGFLHLPFADGQSATECTMPMEALEKGVRVALSACLEP